MKIETFKNQRIRCYDNGGKTIDRYTVIYMDCPAPTMYQGVFEARSMAADLEHAFNQMTTATVGPHLGKRIKLDDMPPACRAVVANDLGAANYQDLFNNNSNK